MSPRSYKLQEGLLSSVGKKFKAQAVNLTPTSKLRLKSFIYNGVERLEHEFEGDIPPEKVLETRKNFNLYLREINKHMKSGKGRTRLSEETLTEIELKLCPLYPFC